MLKRMWSKGNTHPLLVGMQTCSSTLENSMVVSQKIVNHLPQALSKPKGPNIETVFPYLDWYEGTRNNHTQFTQSSWKAISGFFHPEDLPVFIIQNTFYPPGKPRWKLINILFPGDAGLGKHLQLSHQLWQTPLPRRSTFLTKEKGAVHPGFC